MRKSFRELFIWERSIDLAVVVIELTRSFPAEQRWILGDQLRRSALSIPSNIAEGAGRLSKNDFRRFLGIARGSACELATQLEVARRCRLVDESTFADLDDRLALISTGINRFLAKME